MPGASSSARGSSLSRALPSDFFFIPFRGSLDESGSRIGQLPRDSSITGAERCQSSAPANAEGGVCVSRLLRNIPETRITLNRFQRVSRYSISCLKRGRENYGSSLAQQYVLPVITVSGAERIHPQIPCGNSSWVPGSGCTRSQSRQWTRNATRRGAGSQAACRSSGLLYSLGHRFFIRM